MQLLDVETLAAVQRRSNNGKKGSACSKVKCWSSISWFDELLSNKIILWLTLNLVFSGSRII